MSDLTAEELNKLLLGKRVVATLIYDDGEWGAVIDRLYLEGGIVLHMTGRADRAQVAYVEKLNR